MRREEKTSGILNVTLWIAQAILAAIFVWGATMKLFQPAGKLAAMWPWTADHPVLVKLTGALDLLAAIGLIFPAWLRIQPKLTVYAAYSTIALMIAASSFHIMRGEGSQIGINIFVTVAAAFVAWGRQAKSA